MFNITLKIDPALKSLQGLERKFAMAQAIAMTKTAKIAQENVKRAIGSAFDRATPFTMNSTYVRSATPSRLHAEVGFRNNLGNPERHYLVPQVHGGARNTRGFEAHLRRSGLLRPDQYVVPARGYPLDAYGNLPRRVYAAILSDVKAHPDYKAWSTTESKGKRRVRNRKVEGQRVYFASRGKGMWFGHRQHLPPGIYERMTRGFTGPTRGGANGVRMVLAFVRKPAYRSRLPLAEIVQKAIDDNLEGEMAKQLNQSGPLALLAGAQ